MLMSTEEVRSEGDIEPRREDEAIIGVQNWQNSNEEKCKQWRQQWRRKSDSKNSVSVREVEVKEIREMKYNLMRTWRSLQRLILKIIQGRQRKLKLKKSVKKTETENSSKLLEKYFSGADSK